MGGGHASVSPHVNRQLERTNIAHRPSSAVFLPRTVLRITCMKVHGTIRPRAWSLDFPASTTTVPVRKESSTSTGLRAGHCQWQWQTPLARMQITHESMYPCIQKRTFHPIPLAACPLDVHLPVCLGYIHTVYALEDKKHHRPSVEWKEFPLHLRVE